MRKGETKVREYKFLEKIISWFLEFQMGECCWSCKLFAVLQRGKKDVGRLFEGEGGELI